jgi:hypothetical protein
MMMERIALNEVSMESARPRAVGCDAARGRAGSIMVGSREFFQRVVSVCESECAD